MPVLTTQEQENAVHSATAQRLEGAPLAGEVTGREAGAQA